MVKPDLKIGDVVKWQFEPDFSDRFFIIISDDRDYFKCKHIHKNYYRHMRKDELVKLTRLEKLLYT